MQIKKTSSIQPNSFNCLIYGQSGVGKTTLASTLKNCLVVSCESGLLSLKNFEIDYVEVFNINDLKKIMIEISQSTYKTIFIDSLTEINQMILDQARIKYPQDSQTQKMYGHAYEQMIALIRYFRDLKKNVIFTALEKVEKSDTGKRYYAPELVGQLSQKASQFFDFVFRYEVFTSETGQKKRMLLTNSQEHAIAKSRLQLDEYEEPNLTKVIIKAFRLNVSNNDQRTEGEKNV